VMAKHNIPGPYYSLTLEDGAKDLPDLAVAVLGRPAITRVAEGMSLRLGTQYPAVRVRSCASSEGLHLTLWSGVPLQSERLWHQYYYLGYDVEPTCRPGDLQGDQDAMPAIDFGREIRYFGGVPAGFPWPDHKLLEDPVDSRILNAALQGVTRAELGSSGVADVDSRLNALVKGQCLALDGETYRVRFPVISGEARESIRALVDRAVAPVVGRVTAMAARLAQAAPGRRDALFHLLWSRAMDKFWWPAWQAVYSKPRGAPAVAWVLRPDHPYQVGTNYHDLPGNGEVAVTWSNTSSRHIAPIMAARVDLGRIAWGMPPWLPANADVLRAAGCLDDAGRVRPFVLREGDAVDKLTARIARDYAGVVATLYDYDALAPRFHVAPGQLFAILQHETAYAIYDALIAQGALAFPESLRREGDPDACAQLVSLRLAKRPDAP